MNIPERLSLLHRNLEPSIAHASKFAHTPRALLALKTCALMVVVYLTFSVFSGSELSQQDYKQTFTAAVKGKKGIFVQKALENEIDGPFDNSTLVQLCEKQKWVPGLFMKCESPEGGVAKVRNVFLNCVRYTIEAGATGFVIPEMMARTTGDKLSPVPFDHFFDLPHFTNILSTSCPQIHIYNHVNDLYDIPSTAKLVLLEPTKVNYTTLLYKHVLAAPGNWTTNFNNLMLGTQRARFPPTVEKPLLIAQAKPLLEFPLSYDDPHFVPHFGRILRFREDTRRIAAAVLYALAQKYNLDLGLQKTEPFISGGQFYGAHLRTGEDATAAAWTPFEIQSANYMSEMKRYNLPVMYVAGGIPADLAALSAAANSSFVVETKESLLSERKVISEPLVAKKGFESEWNELQTLTWDQQQLVDYEVLLRSSIFGGTWESTFTWNVAMRRHVIIGGGAWKTIAKREESEVEERQVEEAGEKRQTPAPAVAVDTASSLNLPLKYGRAVVMEPQAFVDPLSVVFGPVEAGKRIVASMWP